MPHITATVRPDWTLELPQEVRQYVQPGQTVEIDLPDLQAAMTPEPNYGMLAVLDEIAKRQEGRRYTDGSMTDQIIREGRDGGMYGDDLA